MVIQATPQQAAFIRELMEGTGHIVLRARAGCGKTSTILMAVEAYADHFPQSEIAVCAFNKAIADEVSARLSDLGHRWTESNGRRVPPKVSASTLHSMGMNLVRFVFRPTVDDKKIRNIIRTMNGPIYSEYSPQIEDLVRYAKQAGVGFFSDLPVESSHKWYELADHFDVNGLDDTRQMAEIVAAAQRVYDLSLDQTQVIDFDDMILFPLVKNLRVKFTKDLVIVDEAQDLSRTRQALARKFVKPGTGRMIIVGDDRQAIYGFTGADATALENLTTALDARVMPLSVTWRCPKAVVREAQRWVPDIEAADTAPEGEVLRVTELPADLSAGDSVLCRNTAPLVSLAYRLIRDGVAVKVEGRAIGEGLKNLVTRWKVRTIAGLLTRLEDYQAREQQKAMAKGNEQKSQEVEDRCETLRIIIAAVGERGGRDVVDVLAFIDDLFGDGATECVVLSTAHRSKGREWDRVFLLEFSKRCPSPWAKQQWQKDQEYNLMYVMVTRARKTLVYVE